MARSSRPATPRRGRSASRRPLFVRWLASVSGQTIALLGVALIAFAGLMTAWLVQVEVLSAARSAVAEALGIGVFPILVLCIVLGLWLVAGATPLPTRRTARAAAIGALVYAIGLGIAGFFTPEWTLGPADLSIVSATGDVGAWLASVHGVAMMLLMALTISALITSHHTAQALLLGGTLGWIGSRWLARQLHTLWITRPRRQPTEMWEVGVGPELSADMYTPETTLPAAEPHLPPAPIATPSRPAPEESTVEAPAAEPVGNGAPTQQTTLPSPADDPARAEPSEGNGRRRSPDGWILPPLSLLKPDTKLPGSSDSGRQAQVIIDTLASFGVDAQVTQINEGPSVTQFGVEPGWDVKTRAVAVKDADGAPQLDQDGKPVLRVEEIGRTRVRVNKITRLTNDLALALAAPSIRVEAPVPGQPVIGIEVPNKETRIVSLRGVIESREFQRVAKRGGLAIALGRGVAGQPIAVDLTGMPHLLIAGATGSGKSVSINGIITSLITHHSPESLRLVLVDPKRVELTEYKAIPHLAFSRVITDAEEVTGVLAVVVTEMERRYHRFQQVGARNITAYNAVERPEGPLPYWVVILDELADLMMVAPVEVEAQLVRLAQLARATGIHLVIATQRPSVDVVTGLIKANFPTRLAFATSSQTDSRVIMDRAGAEKLLGRGDMLFQSQDRITAQRVQGAFVSDEEISGVIGFWTQDRFRNLPRPTLDHQLDEAMERAAVPLPDRPAPPEEPATAEDLLSASPPPTPSRPPKARDPGPAQEPADTMYPRAVALAEEHTRISAAMIQRRLRIGYPRAERLLYELASNGVVGPDEGGPSRVVLARDAAVGTPGGGGA